VKSNEQVRGDHYWSQDDEAIIAEVDRVWERLRHVPVGGRMELETATLQTGS